MKRLVLLGGGHAHVEVLRDFGERPDASVELTLVTPFPSLTYTGMLPGHVAGHYALDECTLDLEALAARARARVVLSPASLVSADANEVVCANGTAVPYDVLSMNVGSVPFVGDARGVERHAIVLRPLGRLVEGWNEMLARAGDGAVRVVTVVGGGAGGLELALAMKHRFRRELGEAAPHVRVISDTPRIATGLAAGTRRRLERRLRLSGIEVQAGSAVAEVGAGYVRLQSGLEFTTDAVFWATGAAAPEFIRQSGFATDERGFLLTNDLLQSPSHPNVFGAGDCVNELGHAMPKAGVFAVRAGPTLAANLRAALERRALQPHVPKPRFLALVSTGGRHAIGSWGPLSWEGRWAHLSGMNRDHQCSLELRRHHQRARQPGRRQQMMSLVDDQP
ncbi:MAG TPA: FAD-dependent oxidoreductase, partial [Gemmatimonadales bacterium]|nr:FAD-dependent oxidoreductase [Gemmatimonadales bacterium]